MFLFIRRCVCISIQICSPIVIPQDLQRFLFKDADGYISWTTICKDLFTNSVINYTWVCISTFINLVHVSSLTLKFPYIVTWGYSSKSRSVYKKPFPYLNHIRILGQLHYRTFVNYPTTRWYKKLPDKNWNKLEQYYIKITWRQPVFATRAKNQVLYQKANCSNLKKKN